MPDVSGTISLPDTVTYDDDTKVTYSIVDGICYIYMWLRNFKWPSGVATISGFPKSKLYLTGDYIAENSGRNGIYTFGLTSITLYRVPADRVDDISISFSYPVAEDWQP